MALDFLLGLYPFLFVVVATLKIIKKYQVMKQFIFNIKTKQKHTIFDIFLKNYTKWLTIFISFKEVIYMWVILC